MDSQTAKEVLNDPQVRETLYGFPTRDIDNRRSNTPRKFDIKTLWNRQKEIIKLDAMGLYTQIQIAEMLNVTPATVSNCLNSTLGKAARESLRAIRDAEFDDFYDDVIDLTHKSMKVYNEILSNESENTKLKKEVADTVTLDLAGMRAPTKIESHSTNTILNADELAELKARGRQTAIDSGKLIDVTEE